MKFKLRIKNIHGLAICAVFLLLGFYSTPFSDVSSRFQVDSLDRCESLSRRKENPAFAPGHPIQFIHIRKAGGTSIIKSFEDQFARLEEFQLLRKDREHETQWDCPKSFKGQGMVYGHRAFGFCKRLAQGYLDSTLFMVVLRDPVARFRSAFDFFSAPWTRDYKFWYWPEFHNLFLGKDLNHLIQQVWELQQERHKVKSSQVRLRNNSTQDQVHIARIEQFFMWFSHHQTDFLCGLDCAGMNRTHIPLDEKLKRAVKNLRRCDVIGISTDNEGFLDQIRFHTNIVPRNFTTFPSKNQAKRRSNLTHESRMIVEQWSWADRKLFETATALARQKTLIAQTCLANGNYQ